MTPADHANTVRDLCQTGERAMAELGWTMRNVNWRAALDALQTQAETAPQARFDKAVDEELTNLRRRAQAAEARVTELETALRQIAEYPRDTQRIARAALATEHTDARQSIKERTGQEWGPDHPSYDEMGQ